ncbi:hypothetical protein KA005_42890 [bacterium]|nr:hypothetical protein [bacterium]
MILFDEITREDTAPAAYSEGEFKYLNETGRTEASAIRHVLEDWFSHYSEGDRKEFIQRFRSGNDDHFRACVFELYIHELLRACGYSVEVHPKMQNERNTRPDFLAKQNCDDAVYIECTVASEGSDTERSAETRKKVVFDTLDQMESPDFFLDLQLRGVPTTSPPGSRLRRQITSWLQSLNFEDIVQIYQHDGIVLLPVYDFVHEGWRIRVRPIPKTGALRGKHGVRPIGFKHTVSSRISRRESVRSNVIDKASRYGLLNTPYIIAVNCLGKFARDQDYLEALYGDQLDQYDGVWLTTHGHRYTRISGVLGVLKLDPWQLARRDICLYHNPHPFLRYGGVLSRFKQCNVRSGNVQFIDGEHPRMLLTLPEQWPEC